MVSTQSIPLFYRLELLPDSETISVAHPLELSSILAEYSDIFSKPHGLPPSRPLDHAIHLFPNTNPVNVKPY